MARQGVSLILQLNPLGFYSPLLAAIEKYCDEISDFGQFILIPRQLAAGWFISNGREYGASKNIWA